MSQSYLIAMSTMNNSQVFHLQFFILYHFVGQFKILGIDQSLFVTFWLGA